MMKQRLALGTIMMASTARQCSKSLNERCTRALAHVRAVRIISTYRMSVLRRQRMQLIILPSMGKINKH